MFNRITFALTLSLSLLALTGCDQSQGTSTADGTRAPSASPRNTPPAKPVAPDNTANNKPEMANSDKTPMDQSQSQADISLTAEIRRGIMKDSSMSMNAQNCKIITENGKVTLRGPVNSQAEKDRIGSLASGVPGVTSVDNLLEIKADGA